MNILRNIGDFLFARKCVVCDAILYKDAVFCDECDKLFSKNKDKICCMCKNPHRLCHCPPDNTGDTPVEGFYHLCEYNDFTKRIILYIKETENKRLFDFLADELTSLIRENIPLYLGNFVITYVPRSKKNIRKCGFDHAKTLAKAVSEKAKIPFVCAFERKRGKDQKKLDAKEREENAKISFALYKNGEEIKDKNIIIIDDTATTGNTLISCAFLAQNLCGDIFCVTIAKTSQNK